MFLIVFRAIMILASETIQKGVIRDQRKEQYRKTKITTTLLPIGCPDSICPEKKTSF